MSQLQQKKKAIVHTTKNVSGNQHQHNFDIAGITHQQSVG